MFTKTRHLLEADVIDFQAKKSAGLDQLSRFRSLEKKHKFEDHPYPDKYNAFVDHVTSVIGDDEAHPKLQDHIYNKYPKMATMGEEINLPKHERSAHIKHYDPPPEREHFK